MFEEKLIQQALKLAEKAANPSPNPRVGCVIWKNGKIVGKGFHVKAGESHAEIIALKQAGKAAENSTLVVNLEPCNHFGKTPPCSKAILQAGVKRVVIGMRDKSKAKGGIEFLRKNGVEVKAGICEKECRELNQIWLKNTQRKLPYLTLKLALDKDGKTIPPKGKKWITGNLARKEVMQMRRKHDAILVGVNTILIDNPRLNVRGLRVEKQPVRIVLNPNQRDISKAKIWKEKGKNRIITRKEFPSFNLQQILQKLYNEGICSILVEGGEITAKHLLKANLVDRLEIFQHGKTTQLFSFAKGNSVESKRNFGEDILFTTLLHKY